MVSTMCSPEVLQMAMEEHRVTDSEDESMVGRGEERGCECTQDGSVDIRGKPASKARTGGWVAGILVLVNQGLATLAFFGVNVNLVLFLTRVMQLDNATAANNVSNWTGTVYLFSLLGAFLSDSYWGRYKTCAFFQGIFVLGLAMLSVFTHSSLIEPHGCGTAHKHCRPHSSLHIAVFYLAIYMIALGYGGYQPNIATFGADQFDEVDAKESSSKVSFFSYFYLALNLGSLLSNTLLSYYENKGMWVTSFWASSASALAALVLFLAGTVRYRHFRPSGNPLSRVGQVLVAALRKRKVSMLPHDESNLFDPESSLKPSTAAGDASKRVVLSKGFKFLDRAAVVSPDDLTLRGHDPWRVCTVNQVEEVKCVLRLLPIWLCTFLYSVVFTQMASIFVEQGAVMDNSLGPSFRVPPASMSAFDILSVAAFIFLYRRVLNPLVCRARKCGRGMSELERMGIGLVLSIAAMAAAGTVEIYRLRRVRMWCRPEGCAESSRLSIMWQVPQYTLVGASEVFMYVGQLEFFNSEAPDGLKSFASALCMTSMSMGNYLSTLIVSAVTKATTAGGRVGWIPEQLNHGHLDRFYFLLAALTAVDLVVYVVCARRYKRNQQPLEKEVTRG